MERIIRLFLIVYLKREKYNREEIAKELKVGETQVTRYIKIINLMLFENMIYEEIKYCKTTKVYEIFNMIKETKI